MIKEELGGLHWIKLPKIDAPTDAIPFICLFSIESLNAE